LLQTQILQNKYVTDYSTLSNKYYTNENIVKMVQRAHGYLTIKKKCIKLTYVDTVVITNASLLTNSTTYFSRLDVITAFVGITMAASRRNRRKQ